MSTDPRTDPLAPMGAPPAGKPPQVKGRGPLAPENRRALAGMIIGGVAAVFAVLNLDEVQVNWILGTWETPLIIVIAVSFALGLAAGWFAAQRRGKRKA